ncbi:MAG: YjbH domain-containing protein [Ignavibacteria bacterium]|jgi:hypothetical protein
MHLCKYALFLLNTRLNFFFSIKSSKKYIIISLVSLFFYLSLNFASEKENIESRVTTLLIKGGFNNVAVLSEDNNVIVTYENIIYRYGIDAIREVLEIVVPVVPENMNVILIPQYCKTPIIALTITPSRYRSLMQRNTIFEYLYDNINTTLSVDSLWKRLENISYKNNSDYIINIAIHPQFHAQFGNYDDPVESQINLAPAVETTFLAGMSLSAQLIIPIQNELTVEGDYLRPGLITLSQFSRLPYNIFVSATTGYFTRNRYGFDIEIKKYFGNGKWSLGTKLGYTGYASYYGGVLHYSHLNCFTPFINGGYRFSELDLSVKVTCGKFLYEDTGWRFDIKRQFGEVDIGFFITRTELDHNGGLNFSIPLFPSKYMKSSRVRIRPAKTFMWEYRAKGLTDDGLLYNTGNNIDEFIKFFNPDFINNQLVLYR